jgi:hypothetical protein
MPGTSRGRTPRLPARWSQNENELFHLGTSLIDKADRQTQAREDLKSADYSDYADFFSGIIGTLIFEGPNKSLLPE